MLIVLESFKVVLGTAAKTESFDLPARTAAKYLCQLCFGAVAGIAVGEILADIAFYYVAQGKRSKAH